MERDGKHISEIEYNRPADGLERDAACDELVHLLSSGGDERISLTGEHGLNKYYSAPYPRDIIAYSSSTVSDISSDAFAHLRSLVEVAERPTYAQQLDTLRARISSAYALPAQTGIVFAASGTDLEYVALAAVRGRAVGGIHNILLGADEIGSGCIHSAHGRYFAKLTALGLPSEPRSEVAGCGPISLVDVPVRCQAGKACSSREIAESLAREIELAVAENKHALVHVVHGSKTGLVLPELAQLDELRARFGDNATFVIDACQARITSSAVDEYVTRGCIILMTGSKFMGAPPFNAFALVPSATRERAVTLPEGFATIFNRAEFPPDWPGAGLLPDGANHSLALRLEAAVFELERFQRIPLDHVEAMIAAFEHGVEEHLMTPLGIKRVVPNLDAAGSTGGRPIEMRTLITLDVSMLPNAQTFDEAVALHKEMAFDGIRLGQPVKCVRQEGAWGGTLRIGLSMPIMSAWSGLSADELAQSLKDDLTKVAAMLRAKTHQNA